MNTIKSFEEACAKLNLNPDLVIPELPNLPNGLSKSAIASIKLMIICEALNDGWKPNWNDSNQTKYYPWFDMRQSASGGFSYHGCGHRETASTVGSHLCFKSSDLAKYAAETFTDIYNDFLKALE
jgi:hypothetical protein